MKEIIVSNKAPAPIGPYNQAIKANGLLFVSGCLGLDASSGALLEGIENQAKKALDNLGYILNEAGYDYDNVVKTTVYLKNIADFGCFNAIYATYFKDNCPSRTCVEVSNLPKGALIEIEAIAS